MNLYSMFETNIDETLDSKQNTKKVDILFDLEGESYKIFDSEFGKNIVCVCGSCDLCLENNGRKEIITLDNPRKTIHLNKDIKVKLQNYTNETRIFIQYLRVE